MPGDPEKGQATGGRSAPSSPEISPASAGAAKPEILKGTKVYKGTKMSQWISPAEIVKAEGELTENERLAKDAADAISKLASVAGDVRWDEIGSIEESYGVLMEKIRNKNLDPDEKLLESMDDAHDKFNDLQHEVFADGMKDTSKESLLGEDAQPEPYRELATHSSTYGLMCCAATFLYAFLWAIIFYFTERHQEWTLIDAWYFSIVTLSTVGYGEMTPTTNLTKGLILIFLLMGICFAFFSLSVLTELMLKRLEAFTTEHNLGVYTGCCGPRVLGISVILLTLFGLGTLYGMIIEGWSLLDSLYWTMITVTTTGYGDLVPTSQASKMITSFYIICATYIFAAILAMTISSYIELRRKAAAVKFLMRKLTTSQMKAISRDGVIDSKTWLEYNLVQIGYVDRTAIMLINDCFNALDVDGNGYIEASDLDTVECEELMKNMRARHGIENPDASALPVGLFGLKLKFVRRKEADLEHDAGWETGARVFHPKNGRGTVVSMMEDGRTAIRFDDGTMLRTNDTHAERVMIIAKDASSKAVFD